MTNNQPPLPDLVSFADGRVFTPCLAVSLWYAIHNRSTKWRLTDLGPAVAVSVFLWDYILTFYDEFVYVWRERRWSTSHICFLWNRYTTVIGLVYGAFRTWNNSRAGSRTNLIISDKWCTLGPKQLSEHELITDSRFHSPVPADVGPFPHAVYCCLLGVVAKALMLL